MFELLVTIPLLFSCSLAHSETTDIGIPEDGRLNFTQLSVKYGRQCEELDVETEDGYILTLFHVKGNEGKPPVLLMHGLLSSADAFIVRGESSIALSLADAGYDVYAGNCRGNRYARRHVSLSPDEDKQKFWNFSFHEMAIYDVPAYIDFILRKTDKKKLSAIAHSQGTSLFYIIGSLKPEYSEKVSVSISLAPIAHNDDLGLVTSAFFRVWPVISAFLELSGMEEVFERGGATVKLIEGLCTQGRLSYDICDRGVLSATVGEDWGELEPDFFRVILGHFPAGASRKDMDHISQLARQGYLAWFDYGLSNADHYGSDCTNIDLILPNDESRSCPPPYNFRNVTMPIALIVGGKDKVATVKAAERLKGELPNVVHYQVIDRFNHADFVWAKDLQTYINPVLKEILSKFTNK